MSWSYLDDTSWPIDDISVSIPFPSKMYSGTILESYMDHDYSNRFRLVDWTCNTETHLMSYRRDSARVKWFEIDVVAAVVIMIVFVGWVVPSLRVIVLLQPISKRTSSIVLSSLSFQCE